MVSGYTQTHSIVLPQGVAQVVIHDGVVYAQTAPDLSPLALELGSHQVGFEPSPKAPPQPITDFRPDLSGPLLTALPDWPAPEDTCTAFLNASPLWTLAGRQTLQLEFRDPDRPGPVQLAAPIPLPAHDTALTFRVYLAAHRAEGHLELRRIRHDETGHEVLIDRARLDFDPDFSGGPSPSAYAQPEFRLPPCDHPSEIQITVVHGRHTADPDSDDGALPAVMFVADPRVESDSAEAPARGVHVLPGAPPLGGSAIWQRATLPGLAAPDQPLILCQGSDRYELIAANTVQITLLEDCGHSLLFSASRTGMYTILIDGGFALQQALGPEASHIHLPERYLTGGARTLSVMDAAGVHRLYSTYVLPPRMLTRQEVLQRESRRPFPGPLAAQAGHRYDALKAHLAAGSPPEVMAQLAWALAVLEGGHANVKLAPLAFPQVDQPDVSVVIPAHNQVEVTYLALASLLLARNTATFEVIVVDDASTDDTAQLEDIVSGITVIRNDLPQRFIRACNAGVAAARGRFVALLNNDVEVTTGWLDALIDGFDRFDNVGAVGAKLLYPDGMLQDAGGIVWGNGNPWNYGNRQNPWAPKFCYARQADYLTGAALMTTKQIWDQVGGLSSYLEPMYFDDTDFAFKVRAAGYSTWFIPSSIVYHFEGMTSGTDTDSGFKRYQEVNRPKFKRRWAGAFARHGAEGSDPDLEKDRGIVGRVLFVDASSPRPDRDAGSFAALQEIRMVQSLGYKVTFLPTNLAHLGRYTDDLERMGVEVIYAPFFPSVAGYLNVHAAQFDAVYITRHYVATEVLERIRRLAPRARILFNNADLHFLRELRAGMAANDAELIAKARETRDLELGVMRQSDVVLSYNEVEHSVIQSHTDGAVRVVTCPWVVDLPAKVPPLAGRAGLSFLGNYQHTPNAEAVEWFAAQVMPVVAETCPGLMFSIYGSGLPETLKALENEVITAPGYAEDLAQVYDQHRIFVAPLLSGAGIKGKVLAALAHGVPSVLSPVAAEGIGLRDGHDCLIATDPADWAAAIARLQSDDALWHSLSENARDYVTRRFSFDAGRALMRAAFEAVDLFAPLE